MDVSAKAIQLSLAAIHASTLMNDGSYVQGDTQQISKEGVLKKSISHSGADPENFGGGMGEIFN